MPNVQGTLLGVLDLDALEQQARDFETEADTFTRKAQAVRQIMSGYVALNGDAHAVLQRRFTAHKTAFDIAPRDRNGPRGPKAVLRIMGEQPAKVWKVVEIKREMLARGWAQTPKAVEASVKRLRAEGVLIPAEYGHYKLAPSTGPQASMTTEEEAA